MVIRSFAGSCWSGLVQHQLQHENEQRKSSIQTQISQVVDEEPQPRWSESKNKRPNDSGVVGKQ